MFYRGICDRLFGFKLCSFCQKKILKEVKDFIFKETNFVDQKMSQTWRQVGNIYCCEIFQTLQVTYNNCWKTLHTKVSLELHLNMLWINVKPIISIVGLESKCVLFLGNCLFSQTSQPVSITNGHTPSVNSMIQF